VKVGKKPATTSHLPKHSVVHVIYST
jgi:hypothetical protein